MDNTSNSKSVRGGQLQHYISFLLWMLALLIAVNVFVYLREFYAGLIMSFGLKLDWDITGAMNVCKLSITDADAEPLATLSLGIAPGGEVVEIMPAEGDTVYDFENSDDGNLYGSEIDVQALIEKIEAAGVPEEIIQSVMGY